MKNVNSDLLKLISREHFAIMEKIKNKIDKLFRWMKSINPPYSKIGTLSRFYRLLTLAIVYACDEKKREILNAFV